MLASRHVLGEVVGWLILSAVMLVVAQNYTEIRSLIAEAIIGEPLTQKPQSARKQQVADSAPRSPDSIELRADRMGHFAANIEINGRPVEALVDTGASLIMLSYEDAASVGIYPRPQDFTMVTQTANGQAKAAPVMLSRVALGPIMVRNVQAAVAERGRLKSNLLGMSFLNKLQKFEMRSGRLILQD